MSIRGWERSALLIAASAAAVLGLAACGPTSEPTGGDSPPETSASQPEETGSTTEDESAEEESPTAEETPYGDDKPAAEESSPAEAPSSSAPPQSASGQSGKQGGKTAGAAPNKDDNDPSLCDAADLAGKVKEIRGGAAAGSVHRGIVLTNTADDKCILKGFPGVSYVDAAGNQIGAPADRNTATASPALDLQPGESAMATVRQTNADNYGPQCNQTQAAGLRVYPPSAYDSLIVEQHITACAADGVVLMSIGAFQPMK